MYGFYLGLVDGYVCHKCCIKLHVCGGGVAICCLPGLPSESFPTDLLKHAKFFLWFLNSHFLGGWVPDPPPQKAVPVIRLSGEWYLGRFWEIIGKVSVVRINSHFLWGWVWDPPPREVRI